MPIHLTPDPTTLQLIIKLDYPDVELSCTVKCARSTFPMQISGHLQYLQESDVREIASVLTHEPTTDPFSSISLFSLYGSNMLEWVKRGAIIIGITIFILITFTSSMKFLIKKLI